MALILQLTLALGTLLGSQKKKKKSKLLGSSSLSHPVNWDWNGSLFVKIVMYSNFKTTTSLTEFIVYEL